MKKTLSIIMLLFIIYIRAQISTIPTILEQNLPATIFFDKNGTGLENYSGNIYAHTGITIDGVEWQNTIGNWGDNTNQPQLKFISNTTYKLDIPSSIYQFYSSNSSKNITAINVVFRSEDGKQQTENFKIDVGSFRMTLDQPSENSITNLSSGSEFKINATTTKSANWSLTANGVEIENVTSSSVFNKNYTITNNQQYILKAENDGQVISKSFQVHIKPTVKDIAIPNLLKQGINYVENDPTKAYLVLYAPQKEFIHVIGSFNDWKISDKYVMNRDTTNKDLYWLEVNNLKANDIYTFQYRTSDGIKTADPYSTLILSPYDDQYINEETYPNMPIYPNGQEFEVSVLQTNQNKYNWKTTNFNRPNKENLIIYELLIRDFNTSKTWESLINDFDYFKNLNVNAIEILPVMEFEGNISWGYNTSYHLALDKAYGPASKMKEFIDLCHQNGISVILDIALNHVFGRSPLVRMWMNDPDGDGYGEPRDKNPYLNQEAKHTYNVGYDMNHQLSSTQYYVNRTIEHWINEFNIDGIRWDLTKGFTQECSPSDENCTNDYHSDRVQILKQYADYQWSIDPKSYVIFEHLGNNGSAQEETEWANYRIDEGKGIMLWGKATNNFNQNTMGYSSDSNFNWLNHTVKGFNKKHLVGYAESHDEERIMYKNLQWGASNNSYSVKDLNTSLERQKALGAVLFTIPGPKMLWQFGELGYEYSINYCNDETINDGCRTDPKPIPFEIGYTKDTNRKSVYEIWSKIIELRLNNKVFDTDTYTISSGDLKPRIHIKNDNLKDSELKDVIVIANFETTTQNIAPLFPYLGSWYNLLDETVINPTSINSSYVISLNPGEFRILGNKKTSLKTEENTIKDFKISITPNPTKDYFSLNTITNNIKIYDVSGKLIKEFKGYYKSNHSFDIQSLNKGIYLVVISTEKGKSSTKLIKK
ncbi:alpha-amylase family glycosyl hydrolase [Chishuiella sp.]|uniref:alpha-amylase family glycosyl hydrolase n=1 Tax=Chishuiella sp. TaxID=1969467 RepID=UPI0028AEA115|nr:alpha-amylase family glycosyl hydrolase [Chishuiella sp.]